MTRILLDLRWVIWSLSFPHGNHICAICRHGLSRNSGDSRALLLADLCLFCYERVLCLTFTNISSITLLTCLTTPLDILTIYLPSITLNSRNITLIYIQRNFKWTKQIQCTSHKDISFLDLNIKVIGSDVHTSVYDKRDDFGFPIVNFPWLSGDVPRLPSYGVYISQLVWFARCCISVLDFNSKNLKLTSKLLTRGYSYHKLRKNIREKHPSKETRPRSSSPLIVSPWTWARFQTGGA